MIKNYVALTKPGIIMGNAVTAVGGFMLASKGYIDGWLFLAMFVGLSLVIASGCVLNNYIDREADEKMDRTKNRPLVKKTVSVNNSIVFAMMLIAVGIAVLARYTNMLTMILAIAGFLIYVFAYSLLKYRTSWATVVGSVAGAIPIVVGYCAVTNRLDAGALALFLIIVMWQMPHFFAIAMYRQEDYTAASIPVLPVEKGIKVTKMHMLVYVMAFMVVAIMPTILGYAGYIYMAVAAVLSCLWLRLMVKGFDKGVNDKLWARKMFLMSLIIVMGICGTMSIESFFPSSRTETIALGPILLKPSF